MKSLPHPPRWCLAHWAGAALVLGFAASTTQAIVFVNTGDPSYNTTAPTGDLAEIGRAHV